MDGYALKFRFCENKHSDTVGKGSDKYKTSKKLLVKNVAFEATSKDLRQLFSQFAQVQYEFVPSVLVVFSSHAIYNFAILVTM